ncbi:MAG: alanine--glyoxylate aminotransferase family protein, partial [Pseudomonadota bacterium]
LRLLVEEGLEARWQRHRQTAEKLWYGLSELGLTCHVAEAFRLPTLTTVRVPEDIDAKAFGRKMLQDHNIEIGGGLGELGGKVWRIGLMGHNSTPENVDILLEAMGHTLSAMR